MAVTKQSKYGPLDMETTMTTSQPPVIPDSQKLVTIYLDNTAYAKGKLLVASFADKHGLVEEHLTDLLNTGWKIASIHGFGGSSESLAVRGWLTVLLEKPGDL
jgi:hypothetical protein